MNKKRSTITTALYGAALAIACSGKLVVDDAKNGASQKDGGAGSGGEAHLDGSVQNTGGAELGGGGTGGVEIGGYGGSYPTGGFDGGDGGYVNPGGAGGTSGSPCYSGPEAGGQAGNGTGGSWAGPPTCPLDTRGYATIELSAMCGPLSDGGASLFPCPSKESDLLHGLTCDEVTTDKTGFTRTVGCGFDTVSMEGYGGQELFSLAYDLTSGALTGARVQQTSAFGPCNAYWYEAGTLPGTCPSAVTYKCKHVPLSGGGEANYQGCRAANEPNCSRCCEQNQLGCTIQSGATTYDYSYGMDRPCPCGCTPCAKCKLEDERQFRINGLVDHPECDCSVPRPPNAEPCASFCRNKAYRDGICPGL